jgi:dTDP-4-amino-4,6-dideoxygalactose transaminase
MNDIQAALGCSQLNRLEKNIDLRHKIANRYDEELKNLPIETPFCIEKSYSSYHLYIIKITTEETKKTHKEIFNYLRNEGIGVNLHYIPIYKHPYYQNIGFKDYRLPNSEEYYSKAMSIPMYPMLSNKKQDIIINKLKNFLI